MQKMTSRDATPPARDAAKPPDGAGLTFYRRVKPALTEIGDARRKVASQHAERAGLLRVGGPVLFAAAPIVRVIAELVARPPRLEIELKSSDREVDLVAERLDIVVRSREMRSSTLKARRLGEVRAVVFRSPSYFQRRDRPKHPDELAQHDCVVRLTDGEGRSLALPLRRPQPAGQGERRRADGQRRGGQHGRGVGPGDRLHPALLVRSLVDRGEVEIILEAFEVARVPNHAV